MGSFCKNWGLPNKTDSDYKIVFIIATGAFLFELL